MQRRRKSLGADEQIEEMTRKLASLDRRLAILQRLRPQELCARRDRAQMELLELVELAKMPVEIMGWA